MSPAFGRFSLGIDSILSHVSLIFTRSFFWCRKLLPVWLALWLLLWFLSCAFLQWTWWGALLRFEGQLLPQVLQVKQLSTWSPWLDLGVSLGPYPSLGSLSCLVWSGELFFLRSSRTTLTVSFLIWLVAIVEECTRWAANPKVVFTPGSLPGFRGLSHHPWSFSPSGELNPP